jgi:hypothetical protein
VPERGASPVNVRRKQPSRRAPWLRATPVRETSSYRTSRRSCSRRAFSSYSTTSLEAPRLEHALDVGALVLRVPLAAPPCSRAGRSPSARPRRRAYHGAPIATRIRRLLRGTRPYRNFSQPGRRSPKKGRATARPVSSSSAWAFRLRFRCGSGGYGIGFGNRPAIADTGTRSGRHKSESSPASPTA